MGGIAIAPMLFMFMPGISAACDAVTAKMLAAAAKSVVNFIGASRKAGQGCDGGHARTSHAAAWILGERHTKRGG